MKILKNMKAKSQSNRAEPTSVSMILWIAFAVLIVLTAGVIIFNALSNEADNLATCIGGMVDTATGGGIEVGGALTTELGCGSGRD